MLILSLVLTLGGGPNHDRKGFRYWKDPGAFKPLYKSESRDVTFIFSRVRILSNHVLRFPKLVLLENLSVSGRLS